MFLSQEESGVDVLQVYEGHEQKAHNTYLLVANCELALSLFVALGKLLQLLNRLALQDRDAKLDVGLGVFVSGL